MDFVRIVFGLLARLRLEQNWSFSADLTWGKVLRSVLLWASEQS